MDPTAGTRQASLQGVLFKASVLCGNREKSVSSFPLYGYENWGKEGGGRRGEDGSGFIPSPPVLLLFLGEEIVSCKERARGSRVLFPYHHRDCSLAVRAPELWVALADQFTTLGSTLWAASMPAGGTARSQCLAPR